MKPSPPERALQFLRWFCRADYVEEIEGDLTEVFRKEYESSPRRAKWKFAWSVIRYLRPAFMKSLKEYQPNAAGMYKSYFKIGWRNLLRNKGYSLINISGLGLGMTVVMLIGLWVHDEMTFNTYHENYKQIAQVVTHVSIDGETITYNSLPMPAADDLRTNYKNDFDAVAAAFSGDRIVSHEDNVFTRRGSFSDFTFPQIASLKMKKGNYGSFKDRSHVLLSESFATAMFGTADPLKFL